MSRWSIFWYFTGNFWSKRRKSRWRSVRRPYWISDKKLSGFRILVQRPSNTSKIIKIGQPCLWTNLQILHGFLVDTLLNIDHILPECAIKLYYCLVPRGRCSKIFCRVLHLINSLQSANNKVNSKTIQILYDKNTRKIILLHLPRGTGNINWKLR